MIRKILNILQKKIQGPDWKEIEYFDHAWKKRINAMSKLIPSNCSSVMDIGCGKCWLKEYLSKDIKYYPIDYKLRDGCDVIVCDLNKREFPAIYVDVAFLSGVIEYVEYSNLAWLFKTLSEYAKYLILSYCSLDLNKSMRIRKDLGWKNHLTKTELIEQVQKFNFILDLEINPIDGNNIFRFKIKK